MKTITQERLNEVLKLHAMWLAKKEGGERADLSYTDLTAVNLRGADLRCAMMTHSNLNDADLYMADISYASLRGSTLVNSCLNSITAYRTILSEADLTGSRIMRADLRDAQMVQTTLKHADLSFAILKYADMSNSNLQSASLTSADMRRMNLTDAVLDNANLTAAVLLDSEMSKTELSNVNLQDVIGNGKEVKTVQADTWTVTYTKTHMQIGQFKYTHAECWLMCERKISHMNYGMANWWKVWKPILQQIIIASPAH